MGRTSLHLALLYELTSRHFILSYTHPVRIQETRGGGRRGEPGVLDRKGLRTWWELRDLGRRRCRTSGRRSRVLGCLRRLGERALTW